MRVTLHCVTIWHELHGLEVEVLDAAIELWFTVVDIPVDGPSLHPPIKGDRLERIAVIASPDELSDKAIGLFAIGDKREAWAEFVNPRLKRESDAYYARLAAQGLIEV